MFKFIQSIFRYFDSVEDTNFSVLCWNILHPNDSYQDQSRISEKDKLKALSNFINLKKPDVVCLQDYVRIFCTDYVWHATKCTNEWYVVCGTLGESSKKTESVFREGGSGKGVVVVEYKSKLFASIHLPFSCRGGKHYFDKFYQTVRSYPIYICGDYNLITTKDPKIKLINTLQKSNLTIHSPPFMTTKTLSGDNLCFDHLITTASSTVKCTQLYDVEIALSSSKYPSDHIPVYFEIS